MNPTRQQTHLAEPDWNRPGALERALAAAEAASDETFALRAYHDVLSYVGNDHAGTYFPIILIAVPHLFDLLERGSEWARWVVTEVLVDWLASFEPEPRFSSVDDGEGHTKSLRQLVRSSIGSRRSILEALATTPQRCAQGARHALDLLDEETAP